MLEFIKTTMVEESITHKQLGESTQSFKSESRALVASFQHLEEASVLDGVVNRMKGRIIASIRKDIGLLDTIIAAAKQKGRATTVFEERKKALESLGDRVKGGEVNTTVMIVSIIISYNKILLSIIAAIAAVVGVGAVAISATTFGLGASREVFTGALSQAGSSAAGGGVMSGKEMISVIAKLRDIGVDQARLDKMAAVVSKASSNSGKARSAIAKVIKQGAERVSGSQDTTTAARAALKKSYEEIGNVSLSHAEVNSVYGLIPALREPTKDMMKAGKFAGNVKDVAGKAGSLGKAARSDAAALKKVGEVNKEILDRQKEILQRAMKAEGTAKGNLKNLGAKHQGDLKDVAAFAIKVIAISLILSALLAIVGRILLAVYAGKIKRDAAQKAIEAAVNRTAPKTKRAIASLD